MPLPPTPNSSPRTPSTGRAAPRIRLLALLGTLGVAACGSPPPPILLISVDTLRADRLSSYGYHRPTPAIDALAAEGVLFEEAHSAAPWTLPSHASMLTGQYPSHHGVVEPDHRLGPQIPTVAEALRDEGYQTAGFASHVYLEKNYGLDRGFETYEVLPYRNDPYGARRGDEVVDAATSWVMTADPARPFFLFVHLFDPHWTYRAPKPYLGRYSSDYTGPMDGTLPAVTHFMTRPISDEHLNHVLNLYDEEIAWTDELVDRLVSRVKARRPETVVVLTADHGEEFKEHDAMGHAVTLYREQSHIPLIVSTPGATPQRVETPVRGLDVAPTIAALAAVPEGHPLRAGSDGQVLVNSDGSAARVTPQPVIIETSRWGPLRAAALWKGQRAYTADEYVWLGHRKVDGKVVRTPVGTWSHPARIFDVRSDPHESTPLPYDPTNDAARALEFWRERFWRGVHLEIRSPAKVTVELSLSDPVHWFDEPRVEASDKLLEAPHDDRGVGPFPIPPDEPTQVWLPIDHDDTRALTIKILQGPMPDTTFILADLIDPIIDGGSASESDPASGYTIRLRPFSDISDGKIVEISEEQRRRLEALGYIGG